MKNGVSRFGQKFSEESGILQLMDDLGRAMSTPGEKSMFGGGNPAMIEEVRDVYMKRLSDIADNPDEFVSTFSNYDAPRGNAAFIDSFVSFMQRHYKWDISAENVAITPGSQAGFFSLFNMLAGEMPDGKTGKILFPLVPEYIGYADQGLHDDMFTAYKPQIELIGEHEFKYRVDIDSIKVRHDVTATCVSRPSNPTGNVVSEAEIRDLKQKAQAAGIPLIIDNAYGLPFPGVIEADSMPEWGESIIYSMSLSKVGLPAVRTGIFVAEASIARRLSNITAILSLANANVGQRIVQPMLDDDSLIELCENHIQPFYAERAREMKQAISESFDDSLPYRLHRHEGSYFFWLWLENLPITTIELYERLKARNVIVVPGEYFFPGFNDDWEHKHQCLRLNCSRPSNEVQRGVKIMAEEIAKAYREA